jgi:hypothetical protein
MTSKHRGLLIGGIVLLALAGVLYLTLRLTFGERAAYVHVRWKPDVSEAARAEVERSHGLRPVEFREQRTWGYFLSDQSTENIRAIIRHPAVEDTHNVDRDAFFVLDTAERGDYTSGGPAWIARMLEFFGRTSLLVGAGALLVGAFRTWRERGERATSSPAA